MFVKHWLLPQEACPTVSAVPERILSRSGHRYYGQNVNVRLSVTQSSPTNSFFEDAAIERVIANATRVSMLLVIFVNTHDVAGDHVWCTCVPRSITIVVTGIPQYISFKVKYLSHIVSLDPWTFRIRLPGETVFWIWPKTFRVNWGHFLCSISEQCANRTPKSSPAKLPAQAAIGYIYRWLTCVLIPTELRIDSPSCGDIAAPNMPISLHVPVQNHQYKPRDNTMI